MKFTSTAQLHYLLHKLKINHKKLQQEITEYLQANNIQVKTTAYGRVTGWIGELPAVPKTAPPVARAKRKPRQPVTQTQVPVQYRRRRTMEPH